MEVYSVVDTEERFEFVVLNPNLAMRTFPFRTVLVAEAVDRVVEEFLDHLPFTSRLPVKRNSNPSSLQSGGP